MRASTAKGRVHQIWQARKTTASAPPVSRPSLAKTHISSRCAPGSSASRFITQFVCSGRKRKPRRRKILSNRLAEAVQERQVPSYKIQPRNESPQGGAVSKPVRSTDRSSLISVVSVSSEFIRQKFCHRFAMPSKRKVLSPIFASLSKA